MSQNLRIDPKEFAPSRFQQLLTGAVAPRPIAFASTVDAQGNPNLSPFSFFNAFGVNPSTLIFSPAHRNRDASTKHTYQNIKEVPEVVLNMVSYEMVQQVSLASTEYPKEVNEFIKSGFTPVASECIRPYRVKESPVQFECKVREVIETGGGAGSANLVICEVVMMHIQEGITDERGMINPEKARLVGRMGGDYYVKAFGEGMFKVAKPVETRGIGVDSLPERVRLSPYLTGNDLGILGNQETLPDNEELEKVRMDAHVKEILHQQESDQIRGLHLYAHSLISQHMVRKALCLLFAY